MVDYTTHAPTRDSFGRRGAVIAPGGNDIAGNPKAIVCTATGNVTIIPADNANDAPITFTGCPVGYSPPYVVRRVTAATGSWATVAD